MAKKTKNKLTLQFSGFAEYAEKLDALGGSLKETTEKALKESHAFVTPKLIEAMDKHNQTGETVGSIITHAPVEWVGATAEIKVGFELEKGGMPSIFLMYGTPRHEPNHSGTDADDELYNAIYGNATKKEIARIQKEIFDTAIKKKMEG